MPSSGGARFLSSSGNLRQFSACSPVGRVHILTPQIELAQSRLTQNELAGLILGAWPLSWARSRAKIECFEMRPCANIQQYIAVLIFYHKIQLLFCRCIRDLQRAPPLFLYSSLKPMSLSSLPVSLYPTVPPHATFGTVPVKQNTISTTKSRAPVVLLLCGRPMEDGE